MTKNSKDERNPNGHDRVQKWQTIVAPSVRLSLVRAICNCYF
ncbi:hypothetical protein ACMGD3_09925 [Lysinibacillus sphaericus]